MVAEPTNLQTCETEVTEQFLTALYGNLPEGAHALLWRLPPKRTHWFTRDRIGAAVEWAAQATAQQANVYCGVGLSSKSRKTSERVKNDDAAGMIGFVADVDFAKPDAAKHYPADEAAALALIETFPLAPTIMVHSGHGLQVWWLFPEPWMFADDLDRQTAANLSEAWGKHLQSLAKRQGFDLDSVHDLPRIMRVAGTMNCKAEPVPVTLLKHDGPRHDQEQFRECLPAQAQGELAADRDRDEAPPTAAPVSLPTPATDTFPWDKHDALLMNSEEYRGSWNRTRRDIKDRSASGFDMSLACITAQAGFTDSEIIAVLMAARRKHGDHQQVKHPGYYATTLTKARKLGTVVDQTTDEEPTREQALANLAADLNIPIVNVQLMVSETMPYYLFRFEGGQLIEVPSDAVVTQLTFRRCIFRALHRTPSKISEKQSKSSPLCWDDYVNMIGELGESDPLDSGPNASREGVLLAALEHWFENGNRPVELPPGDVMAPDQPFLRDGKVWFRIDPLLRSLQMTAYRDLTREDIRHRLLRLDAESRKFNVMGRTQRGQADGRRSSKSFWGLPWDDETGLSS